MYYESDYLAHYGVPGMKWGVRKSRPKSTGKRKKAVALFGKKKKAKKPEEKATTPPPQTKTAKEMTDEELREAVNRLSLENTYVNYRKNIDAFYAPAKKEKSTIEKLFASQKDKVLNDLADSARKAAMDFVNKKVTELTAKPNPFAEMEKAVKKMNVEKQFAELTDYMNSRRGRDADADAAYKKLQRQVQEMTLNKQMAELEKYFEEERRKRTGN